MSHTPRDAPHTARGRRSGTLPPDPERRPTTRSPLAPALLPLLALVLFTLLTWQIVADGPLRTVDERLAGAMRRSAPARPVAQLLADLGGMGPALLVLGSALAWYAVRVRRWRAVCAHSLAMAAVPVAVSALKAWTDRAGPLGGSGYFPSGHAATMAVAWGAALLLLLRARRERAPGGRGARPAAPPDHGVQPAPGRLWWRPPRAPLCRALAWAVVLTLVAANGAGLVWCGYHWPADALASWCLATVLLAPAEWFAGRHRDTRR